MPNSPLGWVLAILVFLFIAWLIIAVFVPLLRDASVDDAMAYAAARLGV